MLMAVRWCCRCLLYEKGLVWCGRPGNVVWRTAEGARGANLNHKL